MPSLQRVRVASQTTCSLPEPTIRFAKEGGLTAQRRTIRAPPNSPVAVLAIPQGDMNQQDVFWPQLLPPRLLTFCSMRWPSFESLPFPGASMHKGGFCAQIGVRGVRAKVIVISLRNTLLPPPPQGPSPITGQDHTQRERVKSSHHFPARARLRVESCDWSRSAESRGGTNTPLHPGLHLLLLGTLHPAPPARQEIQPHLNMAVSSPFSCPGMLKGRLLCLERECRGLRPFCRARRCSSLSMSHASSPSSPAGMTQLSGGTYSPNGSSSCIVGSWGDKRWSRGTPGVRKKGLGGGVECLRPGNSYPIDTSRGGGARLID